MKKKLFALTILTILTITISSFATPISTPTNISDTPIIGSSNSSSSSSSCGTVDLSNATSDYMLQPCETAVIRFNNQQSVPLHIAIPEPPSPTQPVTYEIAVTLYWVSNKNIDVSFFPNNYSYSNQFNFLTYFHGDTGWTGVTINSDRFWYDTYRGAIDTVPYFATFKVIYYGTNYPKHMVAEVFDNLSIHLSSEVWNNTTTQWVSLGTFRTDWQSSSGQITVKRIS